MAERWRRALLVQRHAMRRRQSALDEGEQIGVHCIVLSGADAVQTALVAFSVAPLTSFEDSCAGSAIGTI